MSMYAMQKSTVMPNLNAITYIVPEILLSNEKVLKKCQLGSAVVTLSEGQGHRTQKILYRPLVGLSSQETWWLLLKNFMEPTFSERSVWLWTKVSVDIINTLCILMSEAVTVPRLMVMTLTVLEESPAKDTQTDRQTTRVRAHAHTPARMHARAHKQLML